MAKKILYVEQEEELINKQLKTLERQGLKELYMYLIEKHGLPIASDRGILFYEILYSDFIGTGVDF